MSRVWWLCPQRSRMSGIRKHLAEAMPQGTARVPFCESDGRDRFQDGSNVGDDPQIVPKPVVLQYRNIWRRLKYRRQGVYVLSDTFRPRCRGTIWGSSPTDAYTLSFAKYLRTRSSRDSAGNGKEMHRPILLENTPFSCKMYQYKWNDLAKVCKIYEKVRCFGNETRAQRLILAVG